jgi:integrase
MTEKPQRRQRNSGRIFKQRGCARYSIQYYRNGKRIRESTGSTDWKVADQKLRRRLAEISTGTYVGPQTEKILVSELWEPYRRDQEINKRKAKSTKGRWVLHLEPFFGWRRVVSVGTDELDKYVDERMKEGAANATINREMALLRKMFRLGHFAKPQKVVSLPKFPHLTEDNVRLGFLEPEQFTKMAAAATQLWLRAMLEIFHTYGWRRREVVSMRVRQVDFAADVITLPVGSTKNKKGREVPMTATVRTLLAECVRGKQPDDFLFTRNGRPVRDFRDSWSVLCDAAGAPGLLVHDMRRTAVRNLRRAGVDESVIMTISGHKTASVFKRYNIVDSRDRREALAKLENSHKVGHNQPQEPQQAEVRRIN